MKSIVLYLLQMILCSGLLYGYYHLFLRNIKFHQYNRYYLLGATALSIIIPFLNIPIYFSQQEAQPIWINTLQAFDEDQFFILNRSAEESKKFFSWQNILLTLYILACIIFLSKLLLSLSKIKKIVSQNKVEKIEGIYFVSTEERGSPFSFFKWMFWNKKIALQSEQGQQIFRHELFHIQQKHSWDIIFMEITRLLFWINPFFHLVKKELTTIHEFLADQFAIKETDQWNYAELLLMHLLDTPHLQLTNPFFHNQIKRRIAMITSSKKPKYQYFRKILILPLIAIVAILFAFTYKEEQKTFSENDSQTGIPILKLKENNPFQPVMKPKIVTDTPKIKIIEKPVGVTVKEVEIKTKIGNPIIIVDNIRQPKGDIKVILKDLDPSVIKSINILKDGKAIEKYGTDAINGVIEINTKKPDEVIVKELKLEKSVQEVNPESEEVVVVGYSTKKVDGDNKIFVQAETSPSFPGGQQEWQNYLQKNLNALTPVNRGAPAGVYTVKIQFIVDKNGVISDIKPLTNHGYGMEEEVVRIIEEGGHWEPAKQNGHIVKAYKQQPVTFVIEEEMDNTNPKEVVVMGFKTVKKITDTDLKKMSAIYPNPASNSVAIPYNTQTEGTVVIKIQDASGKVFSNQKATIVKGLNSLSVNVSALAKGIYIISVTENNQSQSKVYKLVKQ